MMHALPVLALLFAPSLVRAQGASAVLVEDGYTWLDQNSRMEYPVDLDGDGRLELCGWWSYWSDFGPLQVFFWTQDPLSGAWSMKEDTFGSQDFAYGWDVATGIGDVDGDGLDEMVVCNHWNVEVYEPGVNGVPVRIVDQVYVPNISALDRDCCVADFDEDGREDVALVAGSMLYLLRSVPGGFSLVDSWDFGGGLMTLSVCAADARWDSELEVVVLKDGALPELFVFGVDQDNRLRETVPYAIESGAGSGVGQPIMLADGDVDGDGDEDLVLFGMLGQYQLLRREGAGYTVEVPRAGGPATALADIDSDGDLDGICCGGGGGAFEYNNQPSTFEICLGDGTGSFDASVQFAGVGGHHVAGVLDFDQDGDLDVLGGRVVLLGESELASGLCVGTANSTGTAAELHAAGSHSLARGGPSFTASGLPANQASILIAAEMMDPAQLNAAPFYDGTLCLTPLLGRLSFAWADASGHADYGGADRWGSTPWSLGTLPDTRYGYQAWYRDPAAGGAGANLSSAVSVQLVD